MCVRSGPAVARKVLHNRDNSPRAETFHRRQSVVGDRGRIIPERPVSNALAGADIDDRSEVHGETELGHFASVICRHLGNLRGRPRSLSRR